MIPQLIFLVIFYLSGADSTTADERCPRGLTRDAQLKIFGDRCYYFEINKLRSFQDAKEQCQRNGGTLAMPKTLEMDKFIKTELANNFNVTDYVWIGLEGLPISRHYYKAFWVDGSEVVDAVYPGLQLRENNPKGCGKVMPTWPRIWEMNVCWSRHEAKFVTHRYVCEYPLLPVVKTALTTISKPKTSGPEKNTTTTQNPTDTSTVTTTSPPTPPPTTDTTTTNTTPTPPTTTEAAHHSTVKQCSARICNVECGMQGYEQDPMTGCLLCKCNSTPPPRQPTTPSAQN